MKIDLASASALKAVIENDLDAVARTNAALDKFSSQSLGENEQIALAFHLHGLYSALENTFDQISRTFENHVKDLSRWHQELLEKMFFNMPPLRPAVLPVSVRPVLRDLCGFRHVFRHSYDYPFDTQKLQDLRLRWAAQGPQVVAALKAFAQALPTEA